MTVNIGTVNVILPGPAPPSGAHRSTELIYSGWHNKKMFKTEDVDVPLGRKLLTGTTIRIEGTVPDDAESISIDLKTSAAKWISGGGGYEGVDCHIAFHARFRLDTKTIVRNTFYRNHGWAQDEKITPIFPLEFGKEFNIVIKCDAVNGYTVRVNGQHCFQFQNRVNLGDVKNLVVGNAQVTLITVDA